MVGVLILVLDTRLPRNVKDRSSRSLALYVIVLIVSKKLRSCQTICLRLIFISSN